ncbi:hypothetical protein Tsubulata_031998 [Turnera subulata]|uniref:Uncharacterized protein n=1 Tax=Turnera subulata TaxID=218843 RepID=A0A9Q0FNW9_9ROSI|nr:hypothetical protein Tsubulata_031998 [Turnera subulata]
MTRPYTISYKNRPTFSSIRSSQFTRANQNKTQTFAG